MIRTMILKILALLICLLLFLMQKTNLSGRTPSPSDIQIDHTAEVRWHANTANAAISSKSRCMGKYEC